MEYLLAILAGIIQGVTEFLPISSSGHLLLFHEIFNFNFPDNLFFDVMMHWGTLLAILLFFWRDIWNLILSIVQPSESRQNDRRLVGWLIIGTIPAALIGYFFEDIITEKLQAPLIVAVMLIVVAILFWLVEFISKKDKALNEIDWWTALGIGTAQAIALIPGTSRSGITIIAGLLFGLKRPEAARFSFLLSAPIIFGAGLKASLDFFDSTAVMNVWPVVVGFVAAAIAGFFSIKYLMNYISRHSFSLFAWYRVLLGLVVMAFLFVR